MEKNAELKTAFDVGNEQMRRLDTKYVLFRSIRTDSPHYDTLTDTKLRSMNLWWSYEKRSK